MHLPPDFYDGDPPHGYTEPVPIYSVEFTDESGDLALGQFGAFTSEAEAEKLKARLRNDGESHVRINIIMVFERWEDYEWNR